MLQDFLANRQAIQSADESEAPPRNGNFQPYFAARAPGLTAKPVAADSDPEAVRLDEPEIEVIQEAGQVRRIIVTCKCCEKITIDCEY